VNGVTDPSATDSLQAQTNVSALITCDYYFSNNTIRPFIGAGAGAYSLAQETGKSEGAFLPDYTFYQRFGAMLRGGIEWSHVRAALEYNFVSNPNQTLTGYLGIKVGIFLGGGRFELISGNDSPY
jgi:outer membrane protein W